MQDRAYRPPQRTGAEPSRPHRPRLLRPGGGIGSRRHSAQSRCKCTPPHPVNEINGTIGYSNLASLSFFNKRNYYVRMGNKRLDDKTT